MLEIYFHLIGKDLKGSGRSWALGLALVGALLGAHHFYAIGAPPFETLYYSALALLLASLGFPYRRLIWGPRASVPNLKSSHRFFLGFARSIPANLPFLAYLVWLVPHFNLLPWFASRLRGFPILPREARPSEYLLCLGITALFLVYSEIFGAANHQLERRRGWRVRAQSLVIFSATQLLFAGLAWLAFCTYYDLPIGELGWIAATVAVPTTYVILRWTYRAWLEAGAGSEVSAAPPRLLSTSRAARFPR